MAYTTKDTTQGGRRPVGWWSRKHTNREAQDNARSDYFEKHPNKRKKH